MRTAWILPVALHGILAVAAPAANPDAENDALFYGDIKLTYALPSETSISLNLAQRDVAAETGSCLSRPSHAHSKSRTRARSSSTGYLSSQLASPSSKTVVLSSSAPVSTLTTYKTTVVTTVYETYCPGTSTVTEKGSTYPVTFSSSSLTTKVYSTVVPVTSTVTLTESTVYTTKTIYQTTVVPCEETKTYTSGTVTKTTVVPSSSVVTASSIITVPASSSTKAVPSSYVPVTYTTESTYYVTSTIVKTVTVPCDGTTTVTSEKTTYTKTYPSSSVETKTETTKVPVTTTVTVTSSSAVVPSTKPAESTSYKTTVITTVYTTTCPGTTTFSNYGTIHTQTYVSSTIVTSTITSTYPAGPSSSSSVSRHHTHSHHGHGSSSSCVSKSLKSGASSTGKASSSVVSSKVSVSSSVSSKVSVSSSVSSKVSVSSSVSSKVSASSSASASVSSKASSSVASQSASSSTTPFVCRTPTPDPSCVPCEGQPGSDPKKWCGLTVNDDNYKVTPKTCRTVVYDFTITNTTIAPDGYDRIGLLVNGEMPGPTIEANWGDTIIVHVHNKMANNGTSIHFHGTRQHNSNEMDGATSVTQCPIAPGDSYTYKFVATNYGTSWYHSHFALQTYNGVFGPMVIHGPSSAEFDVDAGVLSLQDWSHDTADVQNYFSETVGPFPQFGPRTMDVGLINGLNVKGSGGERYVLETEFEAGKSYLLRLINVANQATFKFYIDGHSLEVISADYVPIKPYKTNIVNLNPGQRYEVIVKADQTPGSYWIRSDSQDACSAMVGSKDVKAIVNYKGFNAEPTSTAYTYTDECIDEPLASLIPIVPIDAGTRDQSLSKNVLIGPGPQTPNLFKWTLDGSTFVSRWDDPSLWELAVNGTIPNYAGSLQVRYPKLGEWVYLVIQSPIPLPHPIHLHGHDFLVVGAGTGLYTGQPLNLKAPPRRDTALMPHTARTGGYLVIAWETDNPGAWLLHCHIGFHAAMGFTMEIIEGELPEIEKTITNTCQLDKTCKAWGSYAAAAGINDTGI